MPEEIFDLVDDLFDEAKKRRKKSRKRRQRQEREAGPPARRPPAPPARSEPPTQSGGLMGKLTTLFRGTASQQPAGESEPNPEAALETTYRQQMQLLAEIRRNIDEVGLAKQRLEDRAEDNERRLAEFDERARWHLMEGREDLARVALERKRLAVAQVGEFEREIDRLAAEQAQLMRAEARLEAKVEAFRMRKEVARTQYRSAQTQARINEAVGGLNEEFNDVNYSVRRVEAHTRELRSRSRAIDEMIDSGLLDHADDPRVRFDRELELTNVDSDLERLKREVDERDGQAGR